MSDSPPSSHCQQCGAAMFSTPEGLCPRCLMAQVMQPTHAGDAAGAIPPFKPEEIAPHFPQLEILECLGRGGMGVVYKARQKSLNRLVALKLLAPERADDPQFAARFEKEAQALAALNHPHIVGVHDFGQAGGFYYLLMEFVDGVNLRQLLQTKRLTPKEALSIVPPVCEALQCAHDHGIVHRDIKPENLLIDKTGKVKIADFGVAKMLGSIPSDMAASAPGHKAVSQAFGTPDYAAPEQAGGQADHRADIYSLGVVLYEMLTGERPQDKIVPPSKRVQVDIRIDEVVLRALEKTPGLRFATAAEFRTQVEAVTQRVPPPAAHAWQQPEAGWGWLVGKMFGLTFRSRRAWQLANLSALGFLAFLGFVPLPGWQGFFGFSGFFGLIGIAFLVEMFSSSRTGGAGGAAPAMNPWPRRIFILLAALVLVPTVLFLGLLIPVYQSSRDVSREARRTNEAKQREIERARTADTQAQTATQGFPTAPRALEIRWVAEAPSTLTEEMEMQGAENAKRPAERLSVEKRVLLDDTDVQLVGVIKSEAGDQPGAMRIGLTLTREGALKFAKATAEGQGRRLAIILSGRLYSAPVIRESITGGALEINGRFTEAEATTLTSAIWSAIHRAAP